MRRSFPFIVSLCGALLLFSACSKENPENDPLFVKADRAYRNKDLREAKTNLILCLHKYPESWRVHSLLGQTYFDDNRMLEALYHFRQAFAYNQRGQQNPQLASWSEQAKEHLYIQLRNDYADAEKSTRDQLEQKNQALGAEVTRLRQMLEQQTGRPVEGGVQPTANTVDPGPTTGGIPGVTTPPTSPTGGNSALQDRINRARENRTATPPVAPPPVTTPPATNPPVVNPPPVTQPPVVQPPVTPPPSNPVVTPPTPNTSAQGMNLNNLPAEVRARLAPGDKIHKVVAGETLSSIARKYYGDGSKYTLIQKANPRLRGTVLRGGDILKIPSANTQP